MTRDFDKGDDGRELTLKVLKILSQLDLEKSGPSCSLIDSYCTPRILGGTNLTWDVVNVVLETPTQDP